NHGEAKNLSPVILPSILESHKEKVRTMLKREFEKPREHAREFDSFSYLITKQADVEVEQFLNTEHSFNDYVREVKKYKSIIDEIQYNLEKVVRRGMFEILCNDLIRALAKRAESCMTKLLDRMVKDHRESGEELIGEF
ncbi:unnamed protein product, partial [Didymodactylos carnosus]